MFSSLKRLGRARKTAELSQVIIVHLNAERWDVKLELNFPNGVAIKNSFQVPGSALLI